MIGSMMILEAENIESVRRTLANDAYYVGKVVSYRACCYKYSDADVFFLLVGLE